MPYSVQMANDIALYLHTPIHKFENLLKSNKERQVIL